MADLYLDMRRKQYKVSFNLLIKFILVDKKLMSLFNHCSQCQRCCHVTPGFPPLEITLTREERTNYGQVCIETVCKFLAENGCSLDQKKPFSCTLYPLVFDPDSMHYYYDTDCPLMPDYIGQLAQKDSEASLHLRTVNAEIVRLKKLDPHFLANNFAVDQDYFDIQRLPNAEASRAAHHSKM